MAEHLGDVAAQDLLSTNREPGTQEAPNERTGSVVEDAGSTHPPARACGFRDLTRPLSVNDSSPEQGDWATTREAPRSTNRQRRSKGEKVGGKPDRIASCRSGLMVA